MFVVVLVTSNTCVPVNAGTFESVGTLILVIPLNDDDWREHQKIYHLDDVESLLRPYNIDYEMIIRKDRKRKYSDGRAFEEVILFIKFKGD